MPEEKKEEEQTPEPTDDRLSKMAAEIGKLQIQALATSAGAVDSSAVAAIVSKNTKAGIDAQGAVKIQMIDPETGEKLRTASGEDMTPGQFIAQMKAGDYGPMFQDGGPGKPKAQQPGGISKEENPFMPATWNLTEQGRLLKNDPVFAARLQSAAKGLRPENPWSSEGLNITRQSQILRDDPSLAERMRAEVAPAGKNPWLKSQENLTAQVLLIHSQPDKARRLKAEALAANGPTVKKNYIFTPPPGSFKRSGIGV